MFLNFFFYLVWDVAKLMKKNQKIIIYKLLLMELIKFMKVNEDSKITIITYESLTCSHCADFHKNVYPQLKKEFIDTGIS